MAEGISLTVSFLNFSTADTIGL